MPLTADVNENNKFFTSLLHQPIGGGQGRGLSDPYPGETYAGCQCRRLDPALKMHDEHVVSLGSTETSLKLVLL